MATYDRQPRGPARVHTNAAIQHGQEEGIERKKRKFPWQYSSNLITSKHFKVLFMFFGSTHTTQILIPHAYVL